MVFFLNNVIVRFIFLSKISKHSYDVFLPMLPESLHTVTISRQQSTNAFPFSIYYKLHSLSFVYFFHLKTDKYADILHAVSYLDRFSDRKMKLNDL